jgi:hypothetical protein
MTESVPKLVESVDPLFAPNMIWNYVVVTERINKIGRLEIQERVCVTEKDVKESIENFLKYTVINPKAVRGVHYNYAVFTRDPHYVYTGEPVVNEETVEEGVNRRMRDLANALEKNTRRTVTGTTCEGSDR